MGVWKAFDEVIPIFCSLAATDDSTVDGHLGVLERFIVLLFERASSEVRVNEAHKQLFSQKDRSMDGLPPT